MIDGSVGVGVCGIASFQCHRHLSPSVTRVLLTTLRTSLFSPRFPQKRNWADFDAHFEAAGLPQLVEYTKKKLYEVHGRELGQTVQAMVSEEPPANSATLVAEAKAKQAEWGLDDGDVAKVRRAAAG